MKVSEYKQKLHDKFFLRLERKTRWGKEEVKQEFISASIDTITEILEEAENCDE